MSNLKTWATATRSAYRHCVSSGFSRKSARAGILSGLHRQGWHKQGPNRTAATKGGAA